VRELINEVYCIKAGKRNLELKAKEIHWYEKKEVKISSHLNVAFFPAANNILNAAQYWLFLPFFLT